MPKYEKFSRKRMTGPNPNLGLLHPVAPGFRVSPRSKENLPPYGAFDPRTYYTPFQLELFADAILWHDIDNGHSIHEYPAVLMLEHYQSRRKREVFVPNGIPSEEILTEMMSPDGQMMYWRSHPRGRKVNSDERRDKGASYYGH